MEMLNRKNTGFKSLLILLLFIFTNIFFMIPLINEGEPRDSEVIAEEMDSDKDLGLIGDPLISLVGTHPWWNPGFRSRQLINITNPYSVGFENFAVSMSFNYSGIFV